MNTIFRSLVVLLLLAVVSFASIGRITALSGDVSVQRGAKTQKATSNFQLDEKDTIKSSAGATAQIVFNDKTVITVGSNTVFKIEEYLFNDKAQSVRFNVGEGSFKTITGKIAKIAPEKFKVETKTATIGIRGTIFVGNIDRGGALTVACTKGAISVTPNIPAAPPVIVNQGQITKADNKGVEPPRAYTPADMKNLEKTLTTDKKAQGESSGGEQKQASGEKTEGSTTTTSSTTAGTTTTTTTTESVEAPKLAATPAAPAPNMAAIQSSVVNTIASTVGDIATQKATGDIENKIIEISLPTPTPTPTPEPTPIVAPIPAPEGQIVTQYSLAGYMDMPIGSSMSVQLLKMDGVPVTTTMTMMEFVTPSSEYNGETFPGSSTKMWVSTDKKYVYSTDKTKIDYLTANDMIFINSNQFTAGYYSSNYPSSTTIVNPFGSIYINGVTTPVEIRNIPASGTDAIAGFSGFTPVANTFADLVTNVKSAIGGFSNVLKYEPMQGSYNRWIFDSYSGVFSEQMYANSEWMNTYKYAMNFANMGDINNSSPLSSSAQLYVYGAPGANQNLPGLFTTADGGKWYFKYDSASFPLTTALFADAGYDYLYTDAVKVSNGSSVPFMALKSDPNTYPVFYTMDGANKIVYSQKPIIQTYSYDNWPNIVTDMYVKINADYFDETLGKTILFDESVQQVPYLYYKLDSGGVLDITDSKNGKLVNPATGNILNTYFNTRTTNSGVGVGPINSGISNEVLVPSTPGYYMHYTEGVTGIGSLYLAATPAQGADYWKLAIEKASWADKPSDGSIYLYSDYGSLASERFFDKTYNAATYIKFPVSGNGILMEDYLDVIQEMTSMEGSIVQNYFGGSVTTGRVVADGTGNKIVAKNFDMHKGIRVSDTASGGLTWKQYLFNENGQYINSDIGGLDNDKSDTSTKYNWIAGEAVDSGGVAQSVNLMKKVADSANDIDLFQTDGGYANPGGLMTGFMAGGDTSGNAWLGKIDGLDTTSMGGTLTISDMATGSDSVFDAISGVTKVGMSGVTTSYATQPTIASASFLGEDLQAMIVESKTVNGKIFDFALATLPDVVADVNGETKYSYKDDYSSWGYWLARETDTSSNCSFDSSSCNKVMAQGYWVSGYETLAGTISAIAANTQYDYSGHLLGTVTNGSVVAPIKLDIDNIFAASITFGVANPVQLTQIKFNTVGLGSVDSVGALTSVTSAISGSGFSGAASGVYQVIGVNYQGKFYGPNAESIGGAWAGVFNNGNALTGSGVFKARQLVGMP